MIVKLENYNGKYKIVSLALNQAAREDLLKINKMLKEKCPNWRKNQYYKKKNLKFKIACNLLYYKKYKTVKLLTRFI